MIIRSLYHVTRQMNILQKKQENAAANTANVNTPGYKYQELIQKAMKEYEVYNHTGGAENEEKASLGSIGFGTEIDGAYTVFTPGALKETGVATDLALAGPGFFGVMTENGQMAFTRNGNFTISEDRRLVTKEGYPVLGEKEGNLTEIYIQGDELTISPTGEINGSGVRIFTADFADYKTLELRGETLYLGQNGGFRPVDTKVEQGYLETSNVNLMDEMVKMMEVSREFQSNQRVLSVLNDTLQKTVNEIGRN